MRGVAWTMLLGCVALVPSAHARSALELPYPLSFGLFEAATYDERGGRLGTAHFEVEELLDGRVRMTVKTGIDRGASNEASILLAPVEGQHLLRVVEQRSESRDASGHSLGVLLVDHEAGIGRCLPGYGNAAHPKTIALPRQERIANVALNLLFSPIALGQKNTANFQVFVCLGGPRVIEFSAVREPRVDAGANRIVEIRYRPDFGDAINRIAGEWLPHYSFWLDGEGNYLAHRVPLYSRGPEVLVVRDGISPQTLTAAP